MSDIITPEIFLNSVFELGEEPYFYEGEPLVVCSTKTDSKWRNKYYLGHPRGRRRIPVGTAATYYCVSTCEHDAEYPRRNRQSVREAWVVPFDDIGTKAARPELRPSYVIETSPGNYQYGYLIHPFDVSTGEGRLEYDAVLYSAAQAGINDPGCRSATRVVRLPGSLHSSGFVSQVTVWKPERVWELEDLLPALGIEKVYPASGEGVEAVPGKYTAIEDVTDSVYHWLASRGRVVAHGSDWVEIVCPWADEHTDGDRSAGYSPEEYGSSMAPAFKCFHGHCADRTTADFRAWLESQGCTVTWGEIDTTSAEFRARIAQIQGDEA